MLMLNSKLLQVSKICILNAESWFVYILLKYLFNFLGEADKEFQAIIALIHEVEGFAKQYNVPGANINPYTNLTGAVSFVYICLHFLINRLKQKNF